MQFPSRVSSDFDRQLSGYCLTQTALYRDSALLRPPYIGIPPYSDRLISGYRLIQTALYRDAALRTPPYIGMPPYSDRLISGYRVTQPALFRDTALLKPPCWGTFPDWNAISLPVQKERAAVLYVAGVVFSSCWTRAWHLLSLRRGSKRTSYPSSSDCLGGVNAAIVAPPFRRVLAIPFWIPNGVFHHFDDFSSFFVRFGSVFAGRDGPG